QTVPSSRTGRRRWASRQLRALADGHHGSTGCAAAHAVILATARSSFWPRARGCDSAAEVIMIRSYRRAADAEDLKAMTQGKGSPVRNILTVTLPIGVLLWLGMYWLARVFWAGLCVAGRPLVLGICLLARFVWPAVFVAGAFVLGSVWSNARFFRTVGARARPGTDRSTVEVMEVEATRVLAIENPGVTG